MFLNQCCCNNLPSSSGSSGSGGPPDQLEDNCSRGNCSDEVIPRNFRVVWDWQPTIHEGEITLSTPPAGDPFWHVLTHGSICTHHYTTGGWLLKYKEPPDPFPGIAGCAWESDERTPRIEFSGNAPPDGPYPGTSYPGYCLEIPTSPIAYLTIGDGLFGARNVFRLHINGPVYNYGTAYVKQTYLYYEGKTLAPDGKVDCMAATDLLAASADGFRLVNLSTLGASFEDGTFPVIVPVFAWQNAYDDMAYYYDDNVIPPDQFPFFYRNVPPLPLIARITPA